ncbi:Transcription factor iws1 [Malassezia vespertilionis]|uniref:Transcription factor iws1 n=1 Tax=Malassezia vespertilionis TaxID=2020962 RepID=UPI0024B1FADC|nr:Transcription factor iws1 [Malassezia vespertilionis]WFD05537.1 Transcription factor iws1 [Malassezia vespertilionis]
MSAEEETDHRQIFGSDSEDEEYGQDARAQETEVVDTLPSIPHREVTEEISAPPKKKKSKHDDDDDVDDVVVQDNTPEPEGEQVPEISEKERIRAQVDAQIEAALKAGKRRTTRRRATGDDDLELMADEEVSALQKEMILAADEDEEANRLKQPATAKLRMLSRVVSTLQKTHLQQAILDNNLLEGVKRWLEPLPDRSLPALNIQKQLFGVLEAMTIDTISLKMSGLGRVVVFYTLCDRVEKSIKRSAEHLIGTFSSPH